MAPSTNTEDLGVSQVSIDETPPFSNGSGFGLCLALNKKPLSRTWNYKAQTRPPTQEWLNTVNCAFDVAEQAVLQPIGAAPLCQKLKHLHYLM